MVYGSKNPTVYPLFQYTDELANANEMSRKDSKFSLEYCKEICDDVFGNMN